eukprot:gene23656-48440_t
MTSESDQRRAMADFVDQTYGASLRKEVTDCADRIAARPGKELGREWKKVGRGKLPSRGFVDAVAPALAGDLVARDQKRG